MLGEYIAWLNHPEWTRLPKRELAKRTARSLRLPTTGIEPATFAWYKTLGRQRTTIVLRRLGQSNETAIYYGKSVTPLHFSGDARLELGIRQ
jgi:hypothetical protein